MRALKLMRRIVSVVADTHVQTRHQRKPAGGSSLAASRAAGGRKFAKRRVKIRPLGHDWEYDPRFHMVWRVVWQTVTNARRKAAVFAAVVVAPAAVFLAAGEASQPPAPKQAAEPVDEPASGDATPVDIIAAPSEVSAAPSEVRAAAGLAAGRDARAARWRVVPRFLPAGVASERGLQVRTILAARSISAEFPQIRNIGGVRADSLRWHPNGLALDVMIPNPASSEGIALGNAVVDFVWRNADRFALQDTIWRGVYSTPKGPGGSGNGHFDHVHVTTTGGGYPTGNEVYPR